MPETVKEVQSPYSNEQWVSARIRFPKEDYEQILQRAGGHHTEVWIRMVVREALRKT